MTDKEAFIKALHLHPEDESLRQVYADFLEEQSDTERAALLRKGVIPLTGIDEVALAELGRCTFLPASYDKRFARDIQYPAALPVPRLSWKQYRMLWRLCFKYRRQIRHPQVLGIARWIHDGGPKPSPQPLLAFAEAP